MHSVMKNSILFVFATPTVIVVLTPPGWVIVKGICSKVVDTQLSLLQHVH